MSEKIGKKLSARIYDFIDKNLKDNSKPHLSVVQVGDDAASTIYIKYKRKACLNLGFGFSHKHFAKEIKTKQLIEEIEKLNQNPEITGIIVQLPLPEHISKLEILDSVCDSKDVDCFNTMNIGLLHVGNPNFVPATPLGIAYLLRQQNIDTVGKCCVIIGKSSIVGRPLHTILSNEYTFKATTVICDKYTQNLYTLTKMADILIVAAGKHHLVNSPDQIKQDAVIIDVGIHRVTVDEKKRIQGDVNYEAVKDKCSFITPVPGGVGPITVACLMYNLAKPFLKQTNLLDM